MKEKEMIRRIIQTLKQTKPNFLDKRVLEEKIGIDKNHREKFKSATKNLEQQGVIFFEKGKFALVEKLNFQKCDIIKVTNHYGFAQDDTEKYFIPGRCLKGAMAGDVCFVRVMSHKGNSPEGEVVSIIKHGKQPFTGTIIPLGRGLGIIPDAMDQFKFPIKFKKEKGAKVGDKVTATLFEKGHSHFEHVAEVCKIFGDSQQASVCAHAILDELQIKKRFDKETLQQAKEIFQQGITPEALEGRLDLRQEMIFTIDAKESMDLDDGISLEKTETGYRLGVHIADVSHYVLPKSKLDEEAFTRGTSVYYANQVVPMLPKEISNGICSLSPEEDRLCFSVFMELSETCEMEQYTFHKTVIRSKIKGIYSEINELLEGNASQDIGEKYEKVLPSLVQLKTMCHILIQKRSQRGALEIESSESKIVIEEDVPVDILRRGRGFSERMIEECMLLANEASAKFAQSMEIPFLYRVHEDPSGKKVEDLKQILRFLGLSVKGLMKSNPKPKDFAEILEETKGSKLEKIIHTQVLRSMAKAKYDVEPIGHFGLVLEHYSHFTSPIRRYPDLVIHRILGDVLSGLPKEKVKKRYEKFSRVAAIQSSQMEQSATEAERSCQDCYKAQYMTQFIGKEFSGLVSSVTGFGIYVELENTVEGLIKLENFPEGTFTLIQHYLYQKEGTSEQITIGTKVLVEVISTNTSLGQVDFRLQSIVSE